MRTVQEWQSKHDDEAIPPRVKLRIFDRAQGRCAKCERKVMPGDPPWAADHIVALCNDGQHRENNLQMLCDWCHKEKSRDDLAEKKKVYAQRMAHLGFRPTTKRPMPCGKKSEFKKRMDGRVVRRVSSRND